MAPIDRWGSSALAANPIKRRMSVRVPKADHRQVWGHRRLMGARQSVSAALWELATGEVQRPCVWVVSMAEISGAARALEYYGRPPSPTFNCPAEAEAHGQRQEGKAET